MPKAKRMQVLLMPSGETDWDVDGRMVGSVDLPLSEAGRALVTEVVASQNGESRPRIQVILCSPDEASRDSAEILAQMVGAKVRPIEGLAEVGLGLWEGVRGEDLEGRCPSIYRQWLDDPTRVSAPQGEGLDEAQDRLLAALSKALSKAEGQRVGVVLRPMAWALVHCHLAGQPIKELWTSLESSEGQPRWHDLDRGELVSSGSKMRASA